jgi:hypothetical protein
MKKTIIFTLITLASSFKATCQTIDKQTLSSGSGLIISDFGESVQYVIGQPYQTSSLSNSTSALTQGFLQPIFGDYADLELVHLDIFPNPAIDFVNLSLYLSDDKGAQGSIINMWGQVLITQKFDAPQGEQKLYFSLGNLAPGIYTVKVIANGRAYIKKLLINNF